MSRSSTVDLVVVGLGYVGLPLARSAAAAGLKVVGLDRSRRVVEGLNAGRSHVDDISDYTIPVHGERRGIAHVLLEVRNDLINDARGQEEWAHRLAAPLRLAAASLEGNA